MYTDSPYADKYADPHYEGPVTWLLFGGWFLLMVGGPGTVAVGAARDDARLALLGSVISVLWALSNAVFVYRKVRSEADRYDAAMSFLTWVGSTFCVFLVLNIPMFHEQVITRHPHSPRRLDFGMDRHSPLIDTATAIGWAAFGIHIIGMVVVWTIAKVLWRREKRRRRGDLHRGGAGTDGPGAARDTAPPLRDAT